MAGAGMTDVGRGARRFALPGGMTIGEGWVNDPRQAYNFAKAGIRPQATGDLEGVHGEGVAGAVSSLSAFNGLRSAMGMGGGGGESDDAPGAGLVRRLTSSPAIASKYGLIANPDDVAARSTILQRQAAPPKTGAQSELDTEDVMGRRALALLHLKETMVGREQDVADTESERGAARLGLPEMARRKGLDRTYAQQDEAQKFEQAGTLAAGKNQAEIAKAQIDAEAKQRESQIRGLTDVMNSHYGSGPTGAQRTQFNTLTGSGQKGSISRAELDQIVKSGGLPGVTDPEAARRVLLAQGYDVEDAPVAVPSWWQSFKSSLPGGG